MGEFVSTTADGVYIGNNCGFSGSFNTGVGNGALSSASGSNNVGIGESALLRTSGNSNTAVGVGALSGQGQGGNTPGSFNTGIGFNALVANSTGSFNTAVGVNALDANLSKQKHCDRLCSGNTHTSSASTFVGFGAITSVNGVDNSTALGFSAICFGQQPGAYRKPAVNSIGGFVDWTDLPSDGRFKQNVKENVPGLNFIKLLRPVTYTVDVNAVNKKLGIPVSNIDQRSAEAKSKEMHTGFIAQEVEAAAKQLNYDFNGVDAPKNAADMYGIRYAKFVVPLVKAVQELSDQNDAKIS
jgi:hypothetical protein